MQYPEIPANAAMKTNGLMLFPPHISVILSIDWGRISLNKKFHIAINNCNQAKIDPAALGNGIASRIF